MPVKYIPKIKETRGYRDEPMTLHAALRRTQRKEYPIMLGVFCNKLYLHLDPKLENRTA